MSYRDPIDPQPGERGDSSPGDVRIVLPSPSDSYSCLKLPCPNKRDESFRRSYSYLSTVSMSNDNFSESIYNLAQYSVKSKVELKNSDMAIQYIKQLENELQEQFDQLLIIDRKISRNTMSDDDSLESDYNRKRDEINRRLGGEEEELNGIIEERDQAIKDKQNVENAISDVQEKYDRVLRTLLSLKEKEELLIERDNENILKVEKMDKELEEYKETARKQVESEYQNWVSKLADAEATNVRLKALLRKGELQAEKMEHSLAQKSKENAELNNLCDELIHSGGSRKNSAVQD